MPLKMVYNSYRIMQFVGSTFQGRIRRADPMHQGAEVKHLDVTEAAVPHLSWAASTAFVFKVYLLTFIGTFCGCSGMKFLFFIIHYHGAENWSVLDYLSLQDERFFRILSLSMDVHRNSHIFCMQEGSGISAVILTVQSHYKSSLWRNPSQHYSRAVRNTGRSYNL